MNFLNKYRYVTDILTNASWLRFQSSVFLNQSILSFFSVLMISQGIDKQIILGFLCVYYGVCSAVLYFQPRITIGITRGYLLLAATLLLSSLFYQESYIYAFPVAMTVISIIKDNFSINAFQEYEGIAKAHEQPIEKIFSVSMMLGMIISPIVLPMLGYVADKELHWYLSLCLLAIGVIFASTNSEKKREDKHQANKIKHILSKIHLICALSLTNNAIRFVALYYFMPIAILNITKDLGIGDYALSIVGLFIGFGALVSLFTKNEKEFDPNKTMYIHYRIVIALYMMIALIQMFYVEINYPIILSLIGVIMIIIIEYSSKLWSVGFVATLKNEARTEEENQSYFQLFMAYKSAGGFVGFFISFLFYNLSSIEIIVFLMGFAAIIFSLYVSEKTKEANV